MTITELKSVNEIRGLSCNCKRSVLACSNRSDVAVSKRLDVNRSNQFQNGVFLGVQLARRRFSLLLELQIAHEVQHLAEAVLRQLV